MNIEEELKKLVEPEKKNKYASGSDKWFAWHPVRTGALGTGSVVWLKHVWRNKCFGVTIYQDIFSSNDG